MTCRLYSARIVVEYSVTEEGRYLIPWSLNPKPATLRPNLSTFRKHKSPTFKALNGLKLLATQGVEGEGKGALKPSNKDRMRLI